MDLKVNDIVTMKKKHPCGANKWQVLNIGSEVLLKCTGCGHLISLPMGTATKNIKQNS